jgi:toxin ParE1/3/4
VTGSGWKVRVGGPAKADFDEIIRWTLRRFGPAQATIYADTLSGALAASVAGPRVAGARRRGDIGAEIFTLHVARNKWRGRHLIVFRVESEDRRVLAVLRLLHESMDLPWHLSGEKPLWRLKAAPHSSSASR